MRLKFTQRTWLRGKGTEKGTACSGRWRMGRRQTSPGNRCGTGRDSAAAHIAFAARYVSVYCTKVIHSVGERDMVSRVCKGRRSEGHLERARSPDGEPSRAASQWERSVSNLFFLDGGEMGGENWRRGAGLAPPKNPLFGGSGKHLADTYFPVSKFVKNACFR